METKEFYCPNCKCNTPHIVSKICTNPNRGVRRAALAIISLGASEVIAGPMDEQNFFNYYEIKSTCLSCGYETKITQKENA